MIGAPRSQRPDSLTENKVIALIKRFSGAGTGDMLKSVYDTDNDGIVDHAALADSATTVPNNAITNAKLADVASGTIKGRNGAGTGDPQDLTASQALALIGAVAKAGDSMTGALQFWNCTVATLPSSPTAGMVVFVTDLSGTTTGGLLIYDGTGWRRLGDRGYSAVTTSQTLSPTFSAETQDFTNTIATGVTRTMTLTNTNAGQGASKFRIMFSGGGAGTLAVQYPGGTTIKSLVSAGPNWCDVDWTGSTYKVTASGTL